MLTAPSASRCQIQDNKTTVKKDLEEGERQREGEREKKGRGEGFAA
jgi:hypothetical protein